MQFHQRRFPLTGIVKPFFFVFVCTAGHRCRTGTGFYLLFFHFKIGIQNCETLKIPDLEAITSTYFMFLILREKPVFLRSYESLDVTCPLLFSFPSRMFKPSWPAQHLRTVKCKIEDLEERIRNGLSDPIKPPHRRRRSHLSSAVWTSQIVSNAVACARKTQQRHGASAGDTVFERCYRGRN